MPETEPTAQELAQSALRSHQAGNLARAEQLYLKVLAKDPLHADATHLLGVIALQSGKPEQALELIQRALVLSPGNPVFYVNLGRVCRELGRLDFAVTAYREAIRIDPTLADAYNNLGNVLRLLRHPGEAAGVLKKAVELKPESPEYHNNLGLVFRELGDTASAITCYQTALKLKPDYAEAHSNLGNMFRDHSKPEDAIASFKMAVRLKPGYAEGHSNLAGVLRESGRLEESIAEYRKALALTPGSAQFHNSLGQALHQHGQLSEAVTEYRHALRLKFDLADAHANLGIALQDLGQIREGAVACRTALGLDPENPRTHLSLAFALLLLGEWDEGWREYEWRWRSQEFTDARDTFEQPVWDGESLGKKTILIHAEQGFGDTIHFIRYVPGVVEAAKKSGARVIVECQPALLELLKNSGLGEVQWIGRGEALPAFDLHRRLLSLPLVFGTTPKNVPDRVPYLRADEACEAKWASRLSGGELKVGLVWAGSGGHKNDHNRSIGLKALLPALIGMKNTRFFSLQLGEPAAQLRGEPIGLKVEDYTGEVATFADSAALISRLDLLISVDTAAAHLAGALGRPVWTLLPFAPDWRWMVGSDQTPWYPTMRLFRQPSIGDWKSVVKRVGESLWDLQRAHGG